MNKQCAMLEKVDALPEPRHLFSLPDWADPLALDELIRDGYLGCLHQQRDDKGQLILAMGLQITPKGRRLMHPQFKLPVLFVRSSLAGASFAAMSLIILYLG